MDLDAWLQTLPQRLSTLAARWELWIGPAFRSGTSAVVLACTGPRGEAVLKLSPDGVGLAEEADALGLLAASRRVPAVLADDYGALLLEAVRPGTRLDRLPCPGVAEYARFLRDLHAVGNPNRAPRDLEDWTDVLFAAAARRGADIGDARALRDELVASQRATVLLHGDLRFGNILRGGARELMAIDPMACAGDPCFDAVDYVLHGRDPRRRARRCAELAEAAGLDAERLDAWCRVVAPIRAAQGRRVWRGVGTDLVSAGPAALHA